MAKRKTRRQSAQLYESLQQIGQPGSDGDDLSEPATGQLMMGKFRFQLLHRWITEHTEPCRVADIGGGKGLLAYLLRGSSWDAVVIDPVEQPLPAKYRDLDTGKQVHLAASESVPHVAAEFEPGMAAKYDLLVGMHAHGCNVKIIDAAAEHGCGFVLLPCCIIDEPLVPPQGVHWLEYLAAYAVSRGFAVRTFRLDFSGQNIGLCAPPFISSSSPVV
jgi:hypothetical protein